MTLNRSFKLVTPLALALLAACSTANLASAREAYAGTFTLSVEARWGNMVLPPGDYSFTLDQGTNTGIVCIRGRSGYLGVILNQGTDAQQTFARSELILVRSGENYTIRALRLAELGTAYEYAVPKTGKQLIVQAPQLLERIPVSMGG
jgi:hypothetical protein